MHAAPSSAASATVIVFFVFCGVVVRGDELGVFDASGARMNAT